MDEVDDIEDENINNMLDKMNNNTHANKAFMHYDDDRVRNLLSETVHLIKPRIMFENVLEVVNEVVRITRRKKSENVGHLSH